MKKGWRKLSNGLKNIFKKTSQFSYRFLLIVLIMSLTKKVLICFPPRARKSTSLYFRANQLVQALKREKEFKLNIIPSLAKTGSSSDKKVTLKKIFLLFFKLPFFLKKIKEADIIIFFPSFWWYFWFLGAKLLRKKLVLDHYTTTLYWWEDVLLPPWLKKLFIKGEKRLYQKINLIITHTETMKKEISHFYQVSPSRILTIYSLVDTKLFNPQNISSSPKQLKKYFNLPLRKKIILYHGEYHSFHGVDVIEKMAKLSWQERDDLIFVLVGRKNKNKNNLYYIDYLPFSKLPLILSLADLWLGRFSQEKRGRRAISSCMLQAMAMSKPVLTFSNEESEKIIQDGVNGFLIKTLDPKEIFVKLKDIIKKNRLRKKVGLRARKTILSSFSLLEWQKLSLALKRI